MSRKIPLLWESRSCNCNGLFSISLRGWKSIRGMSWRSLFSPKTAGLKLGSLRLECQWSCSTTSFLFFFSLLSERKSLFCYSSCLYWSTTRNCSSDSHLRTRNTCTWSWHKHTRFAQTERETLTKPFIRKQTSRSSPNTRLLSFIHNCQSWCMFLHQENPVEVREIFFFLGLIITMLVR